MHNPHHAEGKVPGIICFGGSEGGIWVGNDYASRLANKGYAALAVAYFGINGLPKELNNIPLEYFENAIKQLKNNPMVDSNKIAVIGSSRGGELALLLGSKYPDIKAVIAIAPGCYVFQSYTPSDQSIIHSTWTWQGQPLPFLPMKEDEKYKKSQKLPDLFMATMNQAQYIDKAAIEVEKIHGPVLMISGQDDQVWPSGYMAEKAMERLRANHFPFEFKHLDYPNAGHAFISDQEGGTWAGNHDAEIDSWNQIYAFLGRAFR